jgi:uncharacterized protein YqfA (UPF0365 family)
MVECNVVLTVSLFIAATLLPLVPACCALAAAAAAALDTSAEVPALVKPVTPSDVVTPLLNSVQTSPATCR